jgi:hypothetical protein
VSRPRSRGALFVGRDNQISLNPIRNGPESSITGCVASSPDERSDIRVRRPSPQPACRCAHAGCGLLLLHGQITGGIAQGAGQILCEDIRFDPDTGELVTGSFMDYAMPRASDLCAIAIKSNPVPTKTNPLGVKGAGEAGTVDAMPAVANALVDALSEFGVRHIDMPATAEVIWRAMRGGKGA